MTPLKRNLNRITERLTPYCPFLLFWLANAAIFSLFFFGFYPALMSPDSHTQWRQTQTMRLGDFHPYLHTLYIKALAFGTDFPGTIALFQFAVTSVVFCFAFHFVYRQLKSWWQKAAVFICFFVYLLSLPVNFYTMTLWKDVPFAICILIFSIMAVSIRTGLISWNRSKFLLFLILMGATVFRHNGIIYLVFAPVIMITFLRHRIPRKELLVFCGSYIAIGVFLLKILPGVLGVYTKPWWLSRAVIYHETVGFLKVDPVKKHPRKLTGRSRELLLQVIPEEKALTQHTPISWDPIYYRDFIDKGPLYKKEFWDVLTHDFFTYNLPRNFPYFIGNRFTMLSSALLAFYASRAPTIEPEKHDLNTDLRSLSAYRFLERFYGRALWGEKRFTHWNNAIFYLLILGLSLHSIYRKNWDFLTYASATVAQLPFLFLIPTASHFRYYYFVYLVGLLTIPVYLYTSQRLKNERLQSGVN